MDSESDVKASTDGVGIALNASAQVEGLVVVCYGWLPGTTQAMGKSGLVKPGDDGLGKAGASRAWRHVGHWGRREVRFLLWLSECNRMPRE